MSKIGSNYFNCSIPLVFKERYFITIPGTPPLFSVILIKDNKAFFEIKNNKAVQNPYSIVQDNDTGILTVINKKTGMFLYKFRPESETSIVFGSFHDRDLIVKITDKRIYVGKMEFGYNTVSDGIGIEVDDTGGWSMGGSMIPNSIFDLLNKE